MQKYKNFQKKIPLKETKIPQDIITLLSKKAKVIFFLGGP